ncbi:MAG: NAD/NADP octopine/nopaline dehydrogenase family protein [Acidobacteriota bacterium]
MPHAPHTVTIVGGGASAHVLVPFLAGAGHRVQVLTRRPDDWSDSIELQLQSVDSELLETFHGRIDVVSNDPAAVIPTSDVIVLCMPVCAYRKALHQLAPHLRRDGEVFVGTIYGQAGFHWMVDEIATAHDLDHLTTFAVGLIPWICRVIDYGRVGVTYGAKEVNVAAVSPRDRFEALDEIFLHPICAQFLGRGAFVQSDSFLSLTLSVDNQIIHPSRCYGLFQSDGGRWPNRDAIPYFYRDFDELSADIMRDLDADYSLVREGLRARFPERDFEHMLDYLSLERLSYQSANTDIRESFTTSKTLGAIKPPVKQLEDGDWVIDTDHRFFTDDISYGVCIAKWMAEQMALETPTMDAIIGWVQDLRGERYIENGRLQVDSESLAGRFRSGIPPVYGIHDLAGVVD